MTSRPPILLIGMHRSGTSMLTRTLQGFGLWMGRGTTRNEECRFTNRLNYWVFGQASATWERPEGVDALLADDEVRPWVVDYLAGVTDGPAAARYLGLKRFLRYRSMHRIAEPWGFKDPRTTYTLPLWRAVFPDLRVLHITRHGVDVAESLRVRRERAVAASIDRYRRRRGRYVNNPLAPKRGGFGHSPSVGTLEGGLDLWAAYTARARAHVADMGERALELRYEDLLADPEPGLQRIVDFCGLEVGPAAIKTEAAKFDLSRSFSHRSNDELLEFANRSLAILSQHNY